MLQKIYFYQSNIGYLHRSLKCRIVFCVTIEYSAHLMCFSSVIDVLTSTTITLPHSGPAHIGSVEPKMNKIITSNLA